MSAPEEYVVRTTSGTIGRLFDSHAAAWKWAKDAYFKGEVAEWSVHKLGPAIEPPEPREWIVLDGDGDCETVSPLTRKRAEERLAERQLNGSYGPFRLARIVPEDPA